MFSENLERIAGIGIYPCISLLIFFLFFVGLGIWTFKADKKYLNFMSNLPLEKENNETFINPISK
jgi:hypothetical protein